MAYKQILLTLLTIGASLFAEPRICPQGKFRTHRFTLDEKKDSVVTFPFINTGDVQLTLSIDDSQQPSWINIPETSIPLSPGDTGEIVCSLNVSNFRDTTLLYRIPLNVQGLVGVKDVADKSLMIHFDVIPPGTPTNSITMSTQLGAFVAPAGFSRVKHGGTLHVEAYIPPAFNYEISWWCAQPGEYSAPTNILSKTFSQTLENIDGNRKISMMIFGDGSGQTVNANTIHNVNEGGTAGYLLFGALDKELDYSIALKPDEIYAVPALVINGDTVVENLREEYLGWIPIKDKDIEVEFKFVLDEFGGGERIRVAGETVVLKHPNPAITDWDGDGDMDLIVGQFVNDNSMVFFENIGTPKNPEFTDSVPLMAEGNKISLPGG